MTPPPLFKQSAKGQFQKLRFGRLAPIPIGASPQKRGGGVNRRNIKTLLATAKKAIKTAHAPYSRFHVGAAVMSARGKVFAGANVENASYGLTLCAERLAIFIAVTSGEKKFEALAVCVSDKKIPYPCGACLQVFSEFADLDAQIFIGDSKNKWRRFTLGELLARPFSFKNA